MLPASSSSRSGLRSSPRMGSWDSGMDAEESAGDTKSRSSGKALSPGMSGSSLLSPGANPTPGSPGPVDGTAVQDSSHHGAPTKEHPGVAPSRLRAERAPRPRQRRSEHPPARGFRP